MLLDLEKVCLDEDFARVDTLDLFLGFGKMPFHLLKFRCDLKSVGVGKIPFHFGSSEE